MLTRRDFIAEMAAASAAIAAAAVPLPAVIFVAPPVAARAAVVSIHMDQPYIDATGRALPYVPPNGLRAGAPAENLTEAEFRSSQIYF